MSTCYKCGRELEANEVECPFGECLEEQAPAATQSDLDQLKAKIAALELEIDAAREADDESKWLEIDWDKVNSFAELKAVVMVAGYGLVIHVDDPDLYRVKHLLKEKTK